ncbi:unnamed protein product, partial [Prorocentrum cordatum]
RPRCRSSSVVRSSLEQVENRDGLQRMRFVRASLQLNFFKSASLSTTRRASRDAAEAGSARRGQGRGVGQAPGGEAGTERREVGGGRPDPRGARQPGGHPDAGRGGVVREALRQRAQHIPHVRRRRGRDLPAPGRPARRPDPGQPHVREDRPAVPGSPPLQDFGGGAACQGAHLKASLRRLARRGPVLPEHAGAAEHAPPARVRAPRRPGAKPCESGEALGEGRRRVRRFPWQAVVLFVRAPRSLLHAGGPGGPAPDLPPRGGIPRGGARGAGRRAPRGRVPRPLVLRAGPRGAPRALLPVLQRQRQLLGGPGGVACALGELRTEARF